MGNLFGRPDDGLELNFGNTANYSSTIPYMHKMNADAKALVDRINTKNYISNQQRSFSNSENYDMYKLFEKSNGVASTGINNNFSETSPFISPSVYKKLIGKTQKGGADSSESSTSEASTEKPKEPKESKKSKKSKKETTESEIETNEEEETDEEEIMESSMGSYISSSAHSNGINSTVSIGNRRNVSDSVNTSDINIISVE
jgi:hypothetical protein